VRHGFAWLLTLVLAAAGTLLGHALAYRLTGQSAGDVHAYLGHAPQLLLLLATLAACPLAFMRGTASPPAWPFPFLAVGTFVVQEHIERLVHTGELPWLLTTPSFLAGLALQLPLALAAWALARRLLRALDASPRRVRLLPAVSLSVVLPPVVRRVDRAPVPRAARGPPAVLRPC
jgi:hypothetical protein